jgi:hypothetical protein
MSQSPLPLSEYLGQLAGSGVNQVGDIAQVLMTGGRSLADVANILQAASSGGAMPSEQAAIVANELAWVQYQREQESGQKTLLIVGALAVAAWFAFREK